MGSDKLRDRIAAQITPHLYFNYSQWDDANETDREEAREIADNIITDLGLKARVDECCGTMQIEGWVSGMEEEK